MIPQMKMESERLSRLRAKTDRQIVDFVHTRLAETSEFALAAERELMEDRREQAQESLGRADSAFSEAQQLLIALDRDQRRPFERRVQEVSALLARVCESREIVRPLFFIA
jgi:hypothetical protein